MSSLERWIIAMLTTWWVFPVLAFSVVGAMTGAGRPVAALLLWMAAGGLGIYLGVLAARWRRRDVFEGAVLGGLVGLLGSASPIAIFILG